MGVKYDRAHVERWFERVVDTLGVADFARFWLNLAYQVPIEPPLEVRLIREDTGTSLEAEWCRFSLWEKQAALYLFGPRLEKNANHQAWLKSQEARSKEPL